MLKSWWHRALGKPLLVTRNPTSKFTLPTILLALFACGALKADIVIDTFNVGALSSPPLGSQDFPVTTVDSWAVSFQMPGDHGYSLTSATFEFGFNPTTIPQPAPVLGLYADNGSDSPGTLLDSLSLSGAGPQWIYNGGQLEFVYDTFVPTSTDSLAAGQRYWLAFSNTSSTEFFLVGDVGNPNTGTGTYLGAKLNTSPTNHESIPYFSVEAASFNVPEPQAGLLTLVLCVSGLFTSRRLFP